MKETRFEWDPTKAALNLMKHGVSFVEATSVFEDADALYKPDARHSVEEERFLVIGFSTESQLLVVVHCEYEGGDVIRIITARSANRIERAIYASRRFL